MARITFPELFPLSNPVFLNLSAPVIILGRSARSVPCRALRAFRGHLSHVPPSSMSCLPLIIVSSPLVPIFPSRLLLVSPHLISSHLLVSHLIQDQSSNSIALALEFGSTRSKIESTRIGSHCTCTCTCTQLQNMYSAPPPRPFSLAPSRLPLSLPFFFPRPPPCLCPHHSCPLPRSLFFFF